MANYATLKAAVEEVVKTNGTQAITGANLQTVLLSMINSLGADYQFAGVATPSTNAGTPDYNVFYIGGAGTYANFGTSVTVQDGYVCLFKYNGSWTKEQINVMGSLYSTLNNRGANALMGALQNNKVVISDTRTTNFNLNVKYNVITGITIPKGTRVGISYTVNSGEVDGRICLCFIRSDNTYFETSVGTTEYTTEATYKGIAFMVLNGGSATAGNISVYAYVDTAVSIANDNPHINYSNQKGKGTYGYIDSSGEIHSSSVTRYIVYHLYAGQMIRVRVNNATNVAVISAKIGSGDITPVVMSHAYPNITQSASYTPTEDCDVYVCYNESLGNGDCWVYIHGIQNIPSTRPNLSVNFGLVPSDYYRTHQTEIPFPNKSATTASQVYAAYDTLLGSQFTKEQIGTASDGQSLYVYTFTPLRASTNSAYIKKNAQLFIICGQHGWEKASVMGTYTLMKDMFENHTTDPILSYIHSQIELRIVPVANPYGFDNMTYVNANGVNLNRNWPVNNWNGGAGTGDQYGGEAPLDQPETAAINTYWMNNMQSTCFLVLDFHTQSRYNVDTNANISWFSVIGYGYPYIQNLINAAVSTIGTITEHFLVDYAEDIPTAGVCGHTSGSIYANQTSGLAETYFTQVGNMGMTLESTDGLPQGEIDGKNVQTQASELLANFLMRVFNEYSNNYRI